MKTIVIYRTFIGGETIALFPEIPADPCAEHCLSYLHVGQHGAAYAGVHPATRAATPEEIAPLRRELEAIGYELREVKRFTRRHYLTRLQARTRLQALTRY